MEDTSPVVEYLESLKSVNSEYEDETTCIDDMRKEGIIDVNTSIKILKYITEENNKIIDRITARYKIRCEECQMRGY